MNLDNRIFFDKEISVDPIANKKIAVIGYGNQGRAQARNLRDSKIDVLVALRSGSSNYKKVEEDGLNHASIDVAFSSCDILALMIPDNQIDDFISANLNKLRESQTILLSHGYSIVYGKADIPKHVNIIMVAPSGGGKVVRSEYEKGFGVPALVAVDNDYSGDMLETALAYAKAIGSARAAVFTSTFKEETETDLFGEQVILTGSIPMIIIESYKVLLEEGYDPLISWFVCFYELKTITNLMFEKGMKSFYEMVSDTARYGGISRGKRLIDNEFKDKIRKILKEIKNGDFNKELSKGLSDKEDFCNSKNIFDSKDFNEIEKKLLKKIKKST